MTRTTTDSTSISADGKAASANSKKKKRKTKKKAVAKAENRNIDGTFKKGVSGNPAGRPKGLKNQITSLKGELEVALRENIKPTQIAAVINKMVELALEGNVGAGKLILDKVLSNAKEGEDEKDTSQGFKVIIEHANVDLGASKPVAHNIIDVTPTEVEK